MPRIARVVVPNYPHHVTQRGVRRMDVFFSDEDRTTYLDLLAEQGGRYGIQFLAWCLMTNHVHFIVVPLYEHSLAKGIGEAHKRYTRSINFREGARGYLFQGRFFSCPLEVDRLLSAVRYVLRNPVRAGLVTQPWDYQWSSARWAIGLMEKDPLVHSLGPLAEIDDWKAFLSSQPDGIEELRLHTRTGRPLGGESFVNLAEALTGRFLRKRKPGPKHRR